MHAELNAPTHVDGLAQHPFRAVSANFSESLRRILQAAGEDEEGSVRALSQLSLAESAGVSRQALTQYLSARKDKPANPTLEKLCALAGTLGVPPAFLLMSQDDWTRLVNAVHYYMTALQDESFLQQAGQITRPGQHINHQAIAEGGMSMARTLGLLTKAEAIAQDEPATGKRAAIAATCLAPPITGLDSRLRPTLLTLCAIIGASTPYQTYPALTDKYHE